MALSDFVWQKLLTTARRRGIIKTIKQGQKPVRSIKLYRVTFKENGKFFIFDFENQREALKFFNFSRKLKERSEVTYKIIGGANYEQLKH